MKTRRRTSSRATSHRKARRRAADATKQRYENAWDDTVAYREASAERSPWVRARQMLSTRTGRVIMLAPVGALGAYLLIRRGR